MMKSATLAFLILITASAITEAGPLTSFTTAKKHARIIFSDRRVTLYCGCKYDTHGTVNLNSCGMVSAAHLKRANRIEWEHMTPAENFGRQLECWREPLCEKQNGKAYRGRKCCQKISRRFREMESELYNLWPSVGEVNRARSNYRYGVVRPKSSYYGCPIAIDMEWRVVEPDDQAKGIVARANLFMAEHYGIRLSKSQRKLFETWSQKFPPTQWEITWARKVSEVEGYQNQFIQSADPFYVRIRA